MVEITTTLRRWGNSYGILIPKKVVLKANLAVGRPVCIEMVLPKRITGADIFGKIKWKQSTEEIMKELRKNESKWW